MRSSRETERSAIIKQLSWSLLAGLSGLMAASYGYYVLTDGAYPFLRCMYMTIITVTTVGFSEVFPITGNSVLELYTIVVIVLGMAAVLYFSSTLTAFLVSGQMLEIFRKKRMKKDLNKLNGHIIVAGIGSVGQHVIREAVLSGRPCVAIDSDGEHLQEVLSGVMEDVPWIEGDATDEEVLKEAGIDRASSVIFSLSDDRENLFATITARSLNKTVRIITRGFDQRSRNKFSMAGADSVIYTDVISGLRMASESIRPSATNFLDLMVKDRENPRRIDELTIPDSSPFLGRTIMELNVRRFSDALIVAVHDRVSDHYHYNPGPHFKLAPNSTLVVLAKVEDLAKLQRHLNGES